MSPQRSTLDIFLTRYRGPFILLILWIHVTIVTYGAFRNGPAWDEVGHLVAGIEHWDHGTFQLYKVNPPLPRLLAAIPVILRSHAPLKIETRPPFYGRPEWTTGINFVEATGSSVFDLFAWGRMCLIPFSVLGAMVCFWWGEELFGTTAGFLALICWCLDPTMLSNAQLMTPDLAATAAGVFAAWRFRHWVKNRTWSNAALAGISLGFALLTKMTWLVLFLVFPLVWLVVNSRLRNAVNGLWQDSTKLIVVFVVAVYVVNLGYGFEGSFRPVGEYRFVSSPLRGIPFDEWESFPVGNVFKGTSFERIPVPLPSSFVEGVDFQKQEFSVGYESYLMGTTRQEGWWNFYALALLWKTPIGFFLIGVVATLEWTRNLNKVHLLEAIMLLAPALTVILVVSSQTGFCHHMRYVIPVLPFGYIWASRAFTVLTTGYNWRSAVVCCSLSWAVLSSFCAFPNYLSYFNGLVGGTKNAPNYMGMGPMDSTFEWGQDLLELPRWVRSSPFVRQLDGVAFGGLGEIRNAAGIPGSWPPAAGNPFEADDVCQLGPRPGWYAVNIKDVFNESSDFHYFSKLTPFKVIGQTIYVYFVTEHQADELWRELHGDKFKRSSCFWRMNPVPDASAAPVDEVTSGKDSQP